MTKFRELAEMMCKGLMLLWFTDLMNVTEEVTIHRPNTPAYIVPSTGMI